MSILVSCVAKPPDQDSNTEDLEIHFIDVGQGDAILINQRTTEILIDGGEKSSGLVTYIKRYVDGALEAMVATHPHDDHIGGLISVLDIFQVQEIWLNGDSSVSETYHQFLSKVNSEGASIHEAQRGKTINAGDIILSVLHPTVPLSVNTNNNSIVLRLSYGKINFLFMGDAQMEAEENVLSTGLTLQSDVLKVGHHGSRTSSSPKFLSSVRPKTAIYMAGIGNKYGHPHKESLTALTQIGAEIYGTDKHGSITIFSNKDSLRMKTEK